MFLGRDKELKLLHNLFRKATPSLVVCKGRRRIGKSSLVEQFGQGVEQFLEFQGLAPKEGTTRQDQLDNFSRSLSEQSSLPKLKLRDWQEAFSLLSSIIYQQEKTLVFIDEISWMSTGEKNFSAFLKKAWDMEFKHHKNLVLVICGSITSWIDKNIINNTGFVGRVSLTIIPDELALVHCNEFWGKRKDRIADMEKLKVLSVTGGVPRYLEEIDVLQNAEQNIKRMCFQKESFLFNEFNSIFNDIFGNRTTTYRKIVQALVNGKKSVQEISLDAKLERGGTMVHYLNDLCQSGFVAKEITYSPKTGKSTRMIKYRIKDNYLRFYLKYIEPIRDRINQDLYDDVPVEKIVAWDTILGFQFENMVLNHISHVIKILDIDPVSIVSASSYFQRDTTKHDACQIDLLIQTKHTLYPCEIKFRNKVTSGTIQEMKKKLEALLYPKGVSIRPVLIYAGELDKKVEEENYFDQIVSFSDLLSMKTK